MKTRATIGVVHVGILFVPILEEIFSANCWKELMQEGSRKIGIHSESFDSFRTQEHEYPHTMCVVSAMSHPLTSRSFVPCTHDRGIPSQHPTLNYQVCSRRQSRKS